MFNSRVDMDMVVQDVMVWNRLRSYGHVMRPGI